MGDVSLKHQPYDFLQKFRTGTANLKLSTSINKHALFYYEELLQRISRKFLPPQHFFFNSMILVWSRAASIKGPSIGDTGCYHTTNTRINGDFITPFYGPCFTKLAHEFHRFRWRVGASLGRRSACAVYMLMKRKWLGVLKGGRCIRSEI